MIDFTPMEQEELRVLMEEEIFPAIRETREKAQKEYAREDNNAFANFDRIAKSLDLKRGTVWYVYFKKHVDAVAEHVASEGKTAKREDIRGRLLDIIVYAILAWGMEEARMKEEEK